MKIVSRLYIPRTALCLILIASLIAEASALINLEWRPVQQTSEVGAVVEIGLYMVSDDPEMNHPMSAMDVIVQWDPDYLRLLGVGCEGCPNWIFSGFSDDPYGINEDNPPADGDALYTAMAPLGVPIVATPDGTLAVTFLFEALSPTDGTQIAIIESAGVPLVHTTVYDGEVAGLPVTGTLGDAYVEILCQLCMGDLNGDDRINVVDLAELLSNYGAAAGAMPGDGDLDCDGDIALNDLAALLSVYGQTCD